MWSLFSFPGGVCPDQGGQGSIQHRASVTTGGSRPRLRQRRKQTGWRDCQQAREGLHHTE